MACLTTNGDPMVSNAVEEEVTVVKRRRMSRKHIRGCCALANNLNIRILFDVGIICAVYNVAKASRLCIPRMGSVP